MTSAIATQTRFCVLIEHHLAPTFCLDREKNYGLILHPNAQYGFANMIQRAGTSSWEICKLYATVSAAKISLHYHPPTPLTDAHRGFKRPFGGLTMIYSSVTKPRMFLVLIKLGFKSLWSQISD